MERTVIYSPGAPKPVGPYSQAIKTGNTLYVSGQLPMVPETGEMISDDIAKATDRVMKNIWSILNTAGMDFSNVIKCSIFVTNLNDFPIINATYEKFFEYDAPARETIEVKALPKGAIVEISCIAVE
ncbi:MAG: Rid family detoxifying hydrolase [Cyclobacteriaceae bacterium]|nr:Rid family detoxifying hydrolase [Cyclobacteriaceae bacterium]